MQKKITKEELVKIISEKDLELQINDLLEKINGEIPLSSDDLYEIVEAGLPLKYLNVSKIKEIDELFKGKVITEDLSLWDTSNFTSLESTFYLATIKTDISMWDVSNVKDLSFAFSYAKVECDLSNWNTKSLIYLANAFEGATHDFGFSKWNTKKVTDISGALKRASIEDLDLSKWNTKKIKDISSLLMGYGFEAKVGEEFIEYKEIKDKKFKVNISNWDTSSVIEANETFSYSKAQVDLSKWNLSSLKNAKYMFNEYKLINFSLKSLNLENLEIAIGMFFGSNINEDLSDWNLYSIKYVNVMFGETDYNFDIEKILEKAKGKFSTNGVVFNNNKYKHLTSKRNYFYTGNNNFKDSELKDFSYEEKIKLGFPIKIEKTENGKIKNFTEDKNIVYSRLKFKEEIKEKIKNGEDIVLKSLSQDEIEGFIREREGLDPESEFVFLSGRTEDYKIEENKSYYNFDRIGVLYLLKEDNLESFCGLSEEIEINDTSFRGNIGVSFLKDTENLELFEITEGRSLKEAMSNTKKSLLQKVVLFLNKLL